MAESDEEFRAERAVLADELLQRGDAHGELVALQLALETMPADAHPTRRSLTERRIEETADRLHEHLYGVLAPHVTRRSAPDLLDPSLQVLAWRAGFAESLLVQRRIVGPTLEDAAAVVRELPVARFAHELVLGVGDHPAAVAVLAEKLPSTVRSVVFDEWKRPLPKLRARSLAVIDDALAALLKQVEKIRFSLETFSTFSSETLRDLSMWLAFRGGPPRQFVAHLPKLESLEISSFEIDAGFFDRLPSTLQALRVSAEKWERGSLENLFAWPGLARLKILGLGWGFRDDILARFVAHADRLAHLTQLSLPSHNYSAEAKAAAYPRFPPGTTL